MRRVDAEASTPFFMRGLGVALLPDAIDRKAPAARAVKFNWQFGSSASTIFAVWWTGPSVPRRLHESAGVEAGYDIRTVKELLGHTSVETTMIYTHVLNNGRCPVRSPLDQLADHPAAIDCSPPQSITGPGTPAPQPEPQAAQRLALPAPKRLGP